MPNTPNGNALPPEAALARLNRHVAYLAHDRGIDVKPHLKPADPSFESGPERINVRLRNGKEEMMVSIDQGSYTDADEVFETVVLPQLQEAIDELAARA